MYFSAVKREDAHRALPTGARDEDSRRLVSGYLDGRAAIVTRAVQGPEVTGRVTVLAHPQPGTRRVRNLKR
jgi:hypothetical protein